MPILKWSERKNERNREKFCSLHSVLLFALFSQKKCRFSPSPHQMFAPQTKTVFFKNLYPIEIEMVTYNKWLVFALVWSYSIQPTHIIENRTSNSLLFRFVFFLSFLYRILHSTQRDENLYNGGTGSNQRFHIILLNENFIFDLYFHFSFVIVELHQTVTPFFSTDNCLQNFRIIQIEWMKRHLKKYLFL